METEMTRILPFVRYGKRIRNGNVEEIAIDNLSCEEISKMSCESRMLEKEGDAYVLEETPIRFRGTGLRMRLCYIFSELTPEEQQKYYFRSEVILTKKVNTQNEQIEEPKKKVREKNNSNIRK